MEAIIKTGDLIWVLLLLFLVFPGIAYFFFDRIKLKTIQLPRKRQSGYDKSNAEDRENLLGYYYLPKGLVKIDATLIVSFEKSGEQLLHPKILSQHFKIDREIIPDHSELYGLVYQPSILSHDEVEIQINEKGLLTNIESVSEDRIPHIIEALAKAPTEILSTDRKKEAQASEVIQKEFNRTFYLDPSDFKDRDKIAFTWTPVLKENAQKQSININANFEVALIASEWKTSPSSKRSFNGILVRPQALFRFKILLSEEKFAEVSSQEFHSVLPHPEQVVCISVHRSMFVKRTHHLVIENGIVRENKVVKPSEVEGFISIPIHIAKAIVSIPAQLFQFRINTIKKETELTKELIAQQKEMIEKQRQDRLSSEKTKKLVLELQKEVLLRNRELEALRKELPSERKT